MGQATYKLCSFTCVAHLYNNNAIQQKPVTQKLSFITIVFHF